jgi:surface polysaccharide O-acyltransferase-like enzyme
MVLLFIASFVISIESLLPSYFSNLLAYFGYFIFGNIAWNYFGASNKRVMSLAFALFTLASIFTTYNTWELSILKGEFVGVYYGYASIGIIVASLSIFMALLQYQPSQKLNTILTSISSCGLGIYLVHPLVLKIARVEAMDIQYPLGAICVTLSVFFC